VGATLICTQADLPAQLGVDLTHCERQAVCAVEASNGTLQIVQGELMEQSYFDGISAEIDELLQASSSFPAIELPMQMYTVELRSAGQPQAGESYMRQLSCPF
jgi:hypothetical protein